MTINTLGPLIRERREELGLSQHDVSARGGPSHQTLRNIETHAELPPLRHFTINRLERALRLVPGTIREHLNTGSPLEGMSQSAEESVQEQIALLLNTLQSKPAHTRYGSHGKTHSIRLPDDMWARLKEQADSQGVPASELIREALDQYLS